MDQSTGEVVEFACRVSITFLLTRFPLSHHFRGIFYRNPNVPGSESPEESGTTTAIESLLQLEALFLFLGLFGQKLCAKAVECFCHICCRCEV